MLSSLSFRHFTRKIMSKRSSQRLIGSRPGVIAEVYSCSSLSSHTIYISLLSFVPSQLPWYPWLVSVSRVGNNKKSDISLGLGTISFLGWLVNWKVEYVVVDAGYCMPFCILLSSVWTRTSSCLKLCLDPFASLAWRLPDSQYGIQAHHLCWGIDSFSWLHIWPGSDAASIDCTMQSQHQDHFVEGCNHLSL